MEQMQMMQSQQQQSGDSSAPNNKRIIVNYLPSSVTQEQLHAMFAPFGTIQSSHLMTDKVTHSSLCYGFIEYAEEQEALKAIESLNGRQLESKRIKVSIARPKSSEIVNSNVYVSGLGPQITQPMVEALFAPYGQIIDCHILMDQSGVSRGVAFVRYGTNNEAQRAIASLNQSCPFDPSKPITVKLAESAQEKRARQQQGPLVGGGRRMGMGADPMAARMPLLAAQQALTLQQQQNAMMQAQLARTQDPAAAQMAIFLQQQQAVLQQQQQYLSQFDPARMPGAVNPAAVAAAAAGAADPNNTTIFIYNLPAEANEAFLSMLCSPYLTTGGTIASTKVVRDRVTQASKGFGFVTFSKKEDATLAVSTLNGRELAAQPGKPLQVSFKRANQ